MTKYYNAFHSPIGAHSSFTLGCKGGKGGLGLELGKPADENVYIGLEDAKGGSYKALPFFEGADDEAARYDHSKKKQKKNGITPFSDKEIVRDYNLGVDSWTAGDLNFSVYSPVVSAPDPENSKRAEQERAYCPSVIAEITVDNRKGKCDRTAFFGYQGLMSNDSLRWYNEKGHKGIFNGQVTGIMTDDASVVAGQGFAVDTMLNEPVKENYTQGLGGTILLMMKTPAGKKKTFKFAICFYRPGIVTTGMDTSYWYTKFFKSIESVGRYSLKNFTSIKKSAVKSNDLVSKKKLNEAQRFQMIHAIRSYYGSTQLLNYKGKPIWVVNEGEYRMMNTFDLTVDQVFFEMKMNPWTVKNEMDLFTSRYSYKDKIFSPENKDLVRGGISFTHDMGCKNHFSRPEYSSYERYGLTGCFSHMTHEQLVNWILCAAVYYKGTGDTKWMKSYLDVMKKCLDSMMRRDNPVAKERNGLMAYDSDRTRGGAEITTYDSLDVSLGQARNNVYIAVKGWASYLALEEILSEFGMSKEASQASKQATLAADSIAAALNDKGYIPAVIGENCDSQIIPAIEGLIFPYFLKQKSALKKKGEYGALIQALDTHFKTVFKKGACIYPDNGWKLSSSADNSWLSKIYLCQFVARKVMGINNDQTGKKADQAHMKWLLKEENLYNAWSDQMRSGVAMGSKYYPRGVTNILWLEE